MGEIQLPPHWKVVKLNDISQEIQSGGTPYRKKPEFYGGSISWIKTLDLNENIVIDSEEKITEAGFKSIRGKIRPINTVMVAMYGGKGTVGKSGILGITATTNQAVCCIEPNPNNFDSFYLLYYLIYFRPIWMRYAIGTRKDPNISKGIIEKTEIPFPPLPEQKTIAHTLRTIQKAKETRQRELELERERKAALMQYLFTHGTRNEPRKQTEIGKIPESWEVVTLDKVCEFLQYGTSKLCDSDSSGIPVLRIPNVISGKINIFDLKFTKPEKKEFEKLSLKTGDLLFVRTNGRKEYIGRCAVFCGKPPHAMFASYLIRVRLKVNILLPEFFQFYTMTHRGKSYLSGRASNAADGKFNINTQIIKAVLVPIPPLDEQHEVIRTLQACDRKIQALEKEIALTDELFHAMLEQLMTGKISTQPLTETYV
ncbi:restriction endonuclease subunit S [Nostoc sp.]|uniref:restriction endonuclease subunit S n=1 Tax=Nostoc sp. TaxID=1180 RepID=UPI002FF47DB7